VDEEGRSERTRSLGVYDGALPGVCRPDQRDRRRSAGALAHQGASTPGRGRPSNTPWLLVAANCDDARFDISVDFIVEDFEGFRHRAGLLGYGSSGTHADDSKYVLDAIQEAVEAAITDYLKANFDL
jgi:hypothetical protein